MTKEDIKQLVNDYPFQTFSIKLETNICMELYHHNSNRFIEVWFDKNEPNVVTNLFVTLFSNNYLRKLYSAKQVHTIEELKEELSLS